MRTSARIGVAAAALLGAITSTEAARGQLLRPEGPAEQVGQVVGGALDSAGRAVERGLRTAFTRTRGVVESMEVTARVYSRLHWDKELAGSRLVIESRPGGVILLRGRVTSPEAANRAASLAASTIGVSQVISELVSPDSSGEPTVLQAPSGRSGLREREREREPLAEPRLDPASPSEDPAVPLEPLPRPDPLSDVEPLPRPSPELEGEAEPRLEADPVPSIRPPQSLRP